MHYLLNGIYPAVTFQMCRFNNLPFWVYLQKRDMHYLLNGYCNKSIQMWSFKCVASILYKLLQDSFIFYYFHCFHSNHFLVYHKKKWHALSPHLNAIYPAVKFEACIFNTFRVIAESIFFFIFTVHFDSNHFFGLSAKKSDVQYLLIGIYPAVKFQMCSYNSFRVSA
jgi:hypothetical protein